MDTSILHVDDLVRSWKDPDSRAAGDFHPAGSIDLDLAGGLPKSGGNTLTTTTTATVLTTTSTGPCATTVTTISTTITAAP